VQNHSFAAMVLEKKRSGGTIFPGGRDYGGRGLLRFMLFTNLVGEALMAEEAGVDRIFVDLEQRGKSERQAGYHLEKNDHTVEDISLLSKNIQIPIIARINPLYAGTRDEVDAVLAAHAQYIMLPMFKQTDEVERFLEIVNRRARTMLLLETAEAVENAPEIARLEFDELYLGLNDLRISTQRKFAFEFLADGTVDRLRDIFSNKPFGFGGLTILGKGAPLSSEDIMREQARLNCSLAIIRRAFKRDIIDRDPAEEIALLRTRYQNFLERTPQEMNADRERIRKRILEITAAM
jgi:hypothetical protein